MLDLVMAGLTSISLEVILKGSHRSLLWFLSILSIQISLLT